MADTITLARPYAKAVFEYARDLKALGQWSQILHALTLSVTNHKAQQFISNPITTDEQKTELLLLPFTKMDAAGQTVIRRLLSLLIKNKKLIALPDIEKIFQVLREEHEKTVVVYVKSFSALSMSQEERFKQVLSQRLNRSVTLKVTIDKSLIGGAVIQAGDLVIDRSVREQLARLSANLAA